MNECMSSSQCESSQSSPANGLLENARSPGVNTPLKKSTTPRLTLTKVYSCPALFSLLSIALPSSPLSFSEAEVWITH